MKLVVFDRKFYSVLPQFGLDNGAGKIFPLGEIGWCVLKLIRQITLKSRVRGWGEGTITTQRSCYKPSRFQGCFSDEYFEEIFGNFEETLMHQVT